MAVNSYAFQTHWRVKGNVDEVYSILADAESLPRWWPAVYIDVIETYCGGGDGVGTEFALTTRGWLPYILRWQFRVAEVRPGEGFSLKAFGDFIGSGDWRFEQDGDDVAITYDWQVTAQKPLLKYLSPILKSIFSLNHRWAMQTGLESLKLELRRRRAHSSSELAAVPPPPTQAKSGLILTAAVALTAAVTCALLIVKYQRTSFG